MKIFNATEAKDIIPIIRGRETKLSSKLKQLKVGEALFMANNEWKTKSTPYRVANNISKRHGWEFEQGRMPDGSGWVFKRIA